MELTNAGIAVPDFLSSKLFFLWREWPRKGARGLGKQGHEKHEKHEKDFWCHFVLRVADLNLELQNAGIAVPDCQICSKSASSLIA
jgi:hypothetical protein